MAAASCMDYGRCRVPSSLGAVRVKSGTHIRGLDDLVAGWFAVLRVLLGPNMANAG